MQRPIVVLLIEDSQADVRLVQEALRDIEGRRFLLDRVDRLSSALDWLQGRQPDIAVLDLNLPDARGLDSLVVLRTRAPRLPVVVLTGLDEGTGVRALRAGAQDFIAKERLEPELLARSLRYAIERQALLNELESRHAVDLGSDQQQLLESISGTPNTLVAARLFGTRPLRSTSREIFTRLTRMYGEILDVMASADPSEAVPASATEELDEVARRLGVLGADPKDAAEVHAVAIELKARTLSEGEVERYWVCAPVALVELISRLAAYYREYAVELRRVSN